MNKREIEKYRNIELKKLKAVIAKRGIDILLYKAEPIKDKENSIDLLDFEVDENIDTIERENKIKQNLDYKNLGFAKVLFLNNNENMGNWYADKALDFNNAPKAQCYIDFFNNPLNKDEVITVGSYFVFKDYPKVRYKITRKLNDRGLIDFEKYEVVRD